MTVPRRYFCCGPLLLLVLAVRIYTLVHLLCECHILVKLSLGSWMTTCLGKSRSFGLSRVPFVNCCLFLYLVIFLLVLRAGYRIWLYQFLVIAYLFTLLRIIISLLWILHAEYFDRTLEDFDSTVTLVTVGTHHKTPKVFGIFIYATK